MAQAENCHLLLAPEVFAGGFDYPRIKQIAEASEYLRQEISELCQKYNIAFYGSFFSYHSCCDSHPSDIATELVKTQNTKPFNQALLIGAQGETLACYNKMHLIPAFNEHEFLLAGNSPTETFFAYEHDKQKKQIHVGLAVCYDLRFPELFREYAKKEVELFLICAQWPQSRLQHMLALSRARAIENQAFVALVNAVGPSGKIVMGGSSHVFDPQGNLLIDLRKQEQGEAVEINMEQLRSWRENFPALYQFSRPKKCF